MAFPAQGQTVRWGNQALEEIQSISIDQPRGLPIGRTVTWTPNLGTIDLAGFATAHLPQSDYGKRKVLKFEGRTASTGPVVTWFEADCIFENTRIEAVANDAIRFAFTFRIQDTVNAPTNP
jgi:hypothetical protein